MLTATAAKSDQETLLALNADYIRSVQTSDVARFDQILAEDFVCTNPDGSFVDRAGFLARFAGSAPKRDYEAVDVIIRILGEVALIHSGFLDRRPDGTIGKGRYTDIYARRNGRWLCVCAHFVRC